MVDKQKITKVPPKAPEKRAVKKNAGSAKAKKTAARLAAVQVLYQMRLNNQDAKSAVREYISHRSGFTLDGDTFVPPDEELLESIVLGLQQRWGDVDNIVSAALADGKKGEVETLLEAILRAGAYELLAHGSIDTGIIIHDYLNVTNGFYDGQERKLVNGVLDKIAKSVRQ
ncbi:MAG TPA: transcription antitermination factor NusB [Patescibacteria group bacterium]|nr:transcription antitermination factor NusB [Patescibacteria group bacterium]